MKILFRWEKAGKPLGLDKIKGRLLLESLAATNSRQPQVQVASGNSIICDVGLFATPLKSLIRINSASMFMHLCIAIDHPNKLLLERYFQALFLIL